MAWLAACTERVPLAAGPRHDSGADPVQAARPSFVIGLVVPLSGPEAGFGQSAERGVKLAAAEINFDGGLRGHRLEVVALDDRGEADAAVEAAQRLVREGARLVIGELASPRSSAIAPVLEAAGIPMISPASTSPRVTEGRRFVFRACFTDPFQGLVMARFARDRLSSKRVAIAAEAGNEYSTGLAKAFAAEFKALGGTVVAQRTYAAGAGDFAKLVKALAAARPDAIYIPGYYFDVGRLAAELRQHGVTVPLLGADGWSSQRLLEAGAGALEGSYYSDHYSTQDPMPRVQRFVEAYRTAYRAEPDSFAALGYDSLRIAAQALARATETSGSSLRDALASIEAFEGVTGTISMDAQHNARKPAVVVKLEGGRPVYQTAIAPEALER